MLCDYVGKELEVFISPKFVHIHGRSYLKMGGLDQSQDKSLRRES